MRRCPPRMVEGRAIIGVIALYALVLQAFLAFAMPAPALAAGTVLCAEHVPGAPVEDGKAHRAAHPCCTALHVGTLAPPPPPGVAAIAWPLTRAARLAWRPEADLPRTGPPSPATSARGPPAA